MGVADIRDAGEPPIVLPGVSQTTCRDRAAAGEYEVLFQDDTRRYVEQGISLGLSLLIVGAYAGLMGHKRLGWFG